MTLPQDKRKRQPPAAPEQKGSGRQGTSKPKPPETRRKVEIIGYSVILASVLILLLNGFCSRLTSPLLKTNLPLYFGLRVLIAIVIFIVCYLAVRWISKALDKRMED